MIDANPWFILLGVATLIWLFWLLVVTGLIEALEGAFRRL